MISFRRRKRPQSEPPRRKRTTHCKNCRAPLFSLYPNIASQSSRESSPTRQASFQDLRLLNTGGLAFSQVKRITESPGRPLIPEAENASARLEFDTISPVTSVSPVCSLEGASLADSPSDGRRSSRNSPAEAMELSAASILARPSRTSFSGAAISKLRDGIQSAGSNRMRHYCRSCGFSFCAKCANRRIPLPQYGYVFPVRVCGKCFEDVKLEEDSLMCNDSTPSVGVILTGFAKEYTKMGHWTSRQLVMTNAALHRFRPQEGTLLGEERGHIMLDQISTVESYSPGGNSQRFCFTIRLNRSTRRYLFSVPREDQRDDWIATIQKAKEGSAKAVYLSTRFVEEEMSCTKEVMLVSVGKQGTNSVVGSRIVGYRIPWGATIDITLGPDDVIFVQFSEGSWTAITNDVLQNAISHQGTLDHRGFQFSVLPSASQTRLRVPVTPASDAVTDDAIDKAAQNDKTGENETKGKEHELVLGVIQESVVPTNVALLVRLFSLSDVVLAGYAFLCFAASAALVSLETVAVNALSAGASCLGILLLCCLVLRRALDLKAHSGQALGSAKLWKVTFHHCKERDAIEDEEVSVPNKLSSDIVEQIPTRFLKCTQGDMNEAQRRYNIHKHWLKTFNVDQLLQTPQPYFETIKRCYPSFFHGFDRQGYPVNFEIAGSCRRSFEMLREENVPIQSLLLHYAFVQEYLWKYVDPRPWPDGRVTKIMDLKGISFSDLAGPLFDFVKTLSAFVGPNYPERLNVVFLINVPTWFNVIWKMMYPLVHPITRQKTKIYKGGYERELLEYVDASQIPKEYGGTCECEGGCTRNWDVEKRMCEFVRKLNATGVERQGSVDIPSSDEE